MVLQKVEYSRDIEKIFSVLRENIFSKESNIQETLKKYFLSFEKSINSMTFEWSFKKIEYSRDIEKIIFYPSRNQ
jgi:hypothetical protein